MSKEMELKSSSQSQYLAALEMLKQAIEYALDDNHD